jgi:type II secretory pathway pseudopilin PulG
MYTARGKRQGFTVIEAVVSLALAGVGIAATLTGIGSLSHAQAIMLQTERMQRLASDKFHEILATQDFTTPNGDFQDRNDNQDVWEMTVSTSSITNLSTLKVTVHPTGSDSQNDQTSVSGLVFQPPQTTTTAPTAGGG